MTKLGVSVVIVAWNEEANLARVINSAKLLADDIVVVIDEATTDNSSEVAKKLGVRVFTHAHMGIVEPMRQFAIDQAKHPWVCILDADEELPPDLVIKLKQIITTGNYDCIAIPRKNIIFGKWITSNHWWPDYVYRIFRKGSLVLKNEIHSVPEIKGELYTLEPLENQSLIHHHYTSISEYVEHLNRYTDHQAKQLHAKNYGFIWSDLINKPCAEFLTQYFARGGYKDGLHGFSLSLLQAVSEFVLYLKMWQMTNFVDQAVSPQTLTSVLRQKLRDYKWWTYEIAGDVWSKLRRKFGI